MPAVIFLMFLIAALVRAYKPRVGQHVPKPQPICAECTFAHVQLGSNGKRAIFCTFGGTTRAMKMIVQYCTDYRDRNLPVQVRKVGFVLEITPAQPQQLPN